MAIALFVNAVKRISALQLGRDLDVQYKTSFVLCHKLREAIGAEQDFMRLSGVVEVDGLYVGGHGRQKNQKKDRIDRTLAEEQTGKRQSVVVARERGGRTVPVVAPRKAQRFPHFARSSGRMLWCTPTKRRDGQAARLLRDEEDQSPIAFSMDGACTNWGESFFSRMRRAEWGQHHHISGKYLLAYAREMAWREDSRRQPNGSLHEMATGAALGYPLSRVWGGYWQRAYA
jgi:hypothetical protein